MRKQPLKVAIVTQFPADPTRPIGGVEAVSVNLVKGLTSFRDIEVHIVTLDSSVTTTKVERVFDATSHRLPRGEQSELVNAVGSGRRQISRYLLELKPDLVHSHDTYGLMVKGLNIPRVFTIHGFIFGDTLVSGRKLPWLRSRIWRWIEASGWADQPHIISISPYVREQLEGITTGIIHDIDNPISETFFKISRDEKKGTIFSAAVISPRKNTHVLVEALAHLVEEGVDARLRLAGPIVDQRYGESLKDRVSQLGLVDKVIFLGNLDSNEVLSELASASIFSLVSLEENSPMGIEEAMAAGVPVVTSNRCGMPYMVRHGESGYLVNPLDARDVALRLRQLLAGDELREAMGRKAQLIAKDRFHPEVVARRTREVYLDVIKGRNSY